MPWPYRKTFFYLTRPFSLGASYHTYHCDTNPFTAVKLKIFVLLLLALQQKCEKKPVPAPLPDAPVQVASDTLPPPLPLPQDSIAELPLADNRDTLPLPAAQPRPRTGAEQIDRYLPLLAGKRVAALVNQTSLVGNTHLVDTLLALGVDIRAIFAVEHGFRGTADAGEKVTDGKDARTGLPVRSLYGSKKKPTAAQLDSIDWVLFDIQDVGVRFYTYISSMHYVMEACAEQGVQLMVLDRPNPNGHYVDGPLLEPAQQSFVGMHPVPIVHGLTIGEYARMVNGEGWLANAAQCPLTVIPCAHYTHQTPYELPVKPSPNLPNMRAIYLYPSICFFEGTPVSLGRGTDTQFQVYGHPSFTKGNYSFTPVPMEGAKDPPQKGRLCKGFSLVERHPDSIRAVAKIDLSYLLDFYRDFPHKDSFFLKTLFFDKLAGNTTLRQQLIAGRSEAEIRATWAAPLATFRQKRKQYLLYPD